MRLVAMLSLALSAAVCFALPAPFAQGSPQEGKKSEKKAKKNQKKDQKKEAAAPGGAPDDAARMEAMMKLIMPGEHHKALQPLIGEWTTSTTMLMPGAPPGKIAGEGTRKWILGNRYVQEEYKGEMMGMPFQGLGLMGYDNVLKVYVASWVDSLGTGIIHSTGQSDETGKVITLTGDYADPETQKVTKMRMVTKIQDNDHHTFRMSAIDEAGKETPAMEIAFTRKK
jgi:Protein of unknown function (DUF1579)